MSSNIIADPNDPALKMKSTEHYPHWYTEYRSASQKSSRLLWNQTFRLQNSTLGPSRSRRPVRKLMDTPFIPFTKYYYGEKIEVDERGL